MNTQYLNLPDGKISYDDQGTGPLVVCLPSLGDMRAEYRFLAPQLVQAGFRVVRMDLRGLGDSSTRFADYSVASVGADLLALIHSLDAGPAFVVGTSMAAGAAVWASVEQPRSIAGLLLIGPAVHGEVSGPNRLLYSLLFSRPWGPALWNSYYKTLYPTRKPDDFGAYTAALQSNLREPGRIEAVLRSMLASKSASEQRLAQVNVPARVIMGSKDPDFKQPEEEARWVADRIKATYHMVEGAGHYPHAEMPEITAPLVIDFLRETLAEAQHVA